MEKRNYDNFKKVILMNGLEQIDEYEDLKILIDKKVSNVKRTDKFHKGIKESMKEIKLILQTLHFAELITKEEKIELEKYYQKKMYEE